MTKFSDLKGLTLVSIKMEDTKGTWNDPGLIFLTDTGRKFWMGHYQSCCESVSLEETIGDLNDLLNTSILVAEERVGETKDTYGGFGDEQWTFYELRTIKGSVTLRWYGTSNGYYSTNVDFEEKKD